MSTRDRVVIVGLGPVGATLALLLGRAGVETIAIEREADVFPLARAVALDDEALRVLQAAGLPAGEPELLTDRAVRFQSRRGAPLLDLPPRSSPNGHPALAFFQQPALESALRARLTREPAVTLRLGHQVESFEQHVDRVVLVIRDRAGGATSRLEAGWLVACDGARSGVRRRAGIRLRGFTSPQRWLVVDTRTASGASFPGPFEFICDPARPTVSAPLPGGQHRWEFMLLPGERPDVIETPERVRALLARHVQLDDVEIVRAAVYNFHARVAQRWRDGRVLLAGDAAHLSPPFAGQGLSAGLGDAHNLAWKLAAVVRQGAAPALLDLYERERRPHVTRLIGLAVLVGLALQTRRPRVAAVRDVALHAMLRIPPVRTWATGGGWKRPARYRHGAVDRSAGARRGDGVQLPQPTVLTASGELRRLDDVLGGAFALVGMETDPAETLDRSSRATLDRLAARFVTVTGQPPARPPRTHGFTVVVHDHDGTLRAWFRGTGRAIALVRPDRHVVASFEEREAPAVVGALREWLGLPETPPTAG